MSKETKAIIEYMVDELLSMRLAIDHMLEVSEHILYEGPKQETKQNEIPYNPFPGYRNGPRVQREDTEEGDIGC